ncbi:MAG: NlpC/P60 family protein [Pseudomonadota bacterium]|nr:NlpC/P60 family protein [Pseudomonadota bacterium]
MDEAATRAAIVAEAISWIGTPFHDDSRIKGVGVDCAQFVAAVYLATGATPQFETPRYVAQWFLHRDEERLMDFVKQFGKEIQEADAKAGDLVLYKIGRAYAHAAIIIDWPNEIIHAHFQSRMVVRAMPFELDLRGLPVKFFSLFA